MTDDTCEKTANPIEVATGDKRIDEVDYDSAGLRFARTYHSAELGTTPAIGLGAGWSHNYGMRLLFGGGVGVVLEDGRIARLARDPANGNVYRALSNDGYRLTSAASAWLFEKPDGSKIKFDSAGLPLQIIAANGLITTLAYSNGRLTSVTSHGGRQLLMSYDTITGQLGAVTDPAGQSIIFSYQQIGGMYRMTQVMRQDATTRQYHYESTSFPLNVTGVTDESAQRYLTATYDTEGRAISSELGVGQEKVTVSYGSTSSTVTEVGGGSTTFNYDDLGGNPNAPRKCASITRTGSGTWTRALPSDLTTDPQRRPTQATSPTGAVTRYTYDGLRVATVTEAYGTSRARTTTYQYTDSSHLHLPTSISIGGRVTTFAYDVNGNPLTRTVTESATESSRTWTYTYTSAGQLWTVNGPRTDVSDVTTYTYHNCTTGFECGQVNTITNALGHVTTYASYNAHAQPLTITDANAVQTTLTYDVRQRLKTKTTSGETTTFDYWPTGLLKKVTYPDASFVQATYDVAHRMTEMADNAGNRVVWTLDAMGNVTATRHYDPANTLTQTRTFAFNALNRVTQETGAAGTSAVTSTFEYDNNGNRTSINAPLGRTQSQTYDEFNRLTTATDALSGLTQFNYNSLDQLMSVADPRNKSTSYTYNALDDLTQISSPDTGATTLTHDAAGNILTRTDARGALTTSVYDSLGRPTSATYTLGGTTDQAMTYSYDAGTHGKGHLTGASDATHSMSWTYDSKGRVSTKTQVVGTINRSIGYSYTSGRLTSVSTPSGQQITYEYSNGRITSVRVNGSYLVSGATYTPWGDLAGWQWSDGTTTTRTYDTDGRISEISSNGLRSYSYDDAERITSIVDATNAALSWTYAYDTLDRLSSATKSGTTIGYTYDASGNRLTQTGTTAATFSVSTTNNRLAAVSGGITRNYSYDVAGNTTGFSGTTFAYNNRGRMKSSTKSGTTTNYIYNALGQLVGKGVNATYIYDEAGHILGIYTGAGALIEEIVWFGDIPIATLRPTSAGVSIYYIHVDHLNAPRIVTNSDNSNVRWRWDADPFGGGAVNDNPSGAGAFQFDLRFPGQIYIQEAGLFHNYYRDYDPVTGRYVQSDPIGLLGGTNTYGYARGNPVRYTDPLGLDADDSGNAYPGYSPLFPAFTPGTPQYEELVRSGTEFLNDLTDLTKWLAEPYFNEEVKPDREQKPDDCPPKTKAVDKDKRLDREKIHKIKGKRGLNAGPKDWVGIDPAGNIWTNEGGKALDNGHYTDYLN